MKHDLLLTAALSTTFCLTIFLVASTTAEGQSLRQPVALTAAANVETIETDSQVKPAGCCDGGSGCCDKDRCGEPVCCPVRVVEEVEKKCWMVKSKFVCVPSFRWPWQCRDNNKSKRGCDADCGCAGDNCCGDNCCSPPKCGRVRCVNVLEEHKYTCKECGYEWNVRCVRRGNSGSCQSGCCPDCGRDPGCGACASLDSTNEVQLTAATVSMLAEQTANKQPPTGLLLLERLGLR